MKKIGLLSDTHAYFHPKINDFFKDVDEIWHAGDIGNIDVYNQLSEFKILKAVYGNIDGQEIRILCPERLIFNCENVKVYMTHIGKFGNNYEQISKEIIENEKPELFIYGHSHILKVNYDKRNKILNMNPGSAGKYGQHHVITFLRFIIDNKNITDLEVMELPKQ